MERDVFNQNAKTFDVSMSSFMTRVYQWMMIGVLITGLVAMVIASNSELLRTFVFGPMRWVAIIAQFGIVITLAGFVNKLSATAATILFLIYSAITGVTLSILAFVYTSASIQTAFFTTGISFAALAVFGHTTKKDLSAIGTFCMMGLIGILVFSLISIFVPSLHTEGVSMFLNIGILLIFAGFTAYDAQRIKAMGQYASDPETKSKMAVIGALSMYLNFINMFISILQLTGDRRK